MAEIELRQVSMEYKQGVKALKQVELQVRDREFLVLLGPSGCGKSTILRLIAGLLVPTEGEVLFDGEDMAGVEARDRNVSMVFQTYALYPHLNVFKNIAFPLGNVRGITKEEIRSRVEEVAKLLEIEHLLNRRPRELSGGQKQRVALGRAMVRKPVVFLFDEPLSNLDVKMRQDLREVIGSLHRQLGTTFVYVTHDQSEAMQLGDRIAVMEDGVIRQVGEPQEVYNNPNCVYVAGFVGSPRMNFFASRFVDRGDHWAVRCMGQLFDLPVSRLPYKTAGIAEHGRVITGIRPEDLKLETIGTEIGTEIGTAAATGTGEELRFTARALAAAPMGAGFHVELETEGTKFLAVFPNHTRVQVGEACALFLDPAMIHLFDPETEQALCIPQEQKN